MPKIETLYAYIAHEKGNPDDEGLTAMIGEQAPGRFGRQGEPLALGERRRAMADPCYRDRLRKHQGGIPRTNGGADGTRTRDLRRDRPAF